MSDTYWYAHWVDVHAEASPVASPAWNESAVRATAFVPTEFRNFG
jgi:hypothetical protein